VEQQTRAMFDAALAEFLFFAYFAEAVGNNRWEVISPS
jgi:hypothetical protein